MVQREGCVLSHEDDVRWEPYIQKLRVEWPSSRARWHGQPGATEDLL